MITFIGKPKGEHIYVDVLLRNRDGEDMKVSGRDPLMLTLDQWKILWDLDELDGERADADEHILWVTTPVGYETSIGESVPA